MTKPIPKPGLLIMALISALLSLALSGCSGLEKAGRGLGPTPEALTALAAAPAPSVKLVGSFPVMDRLQPLVLGPAQALLSHARIDEGQGPRPEVVIFLDGWIDTPTTNAGVTFRAGRSFLEDDRVLLIWGSVSWRIEGREVFSRPYSGDDTVWIKPFWPDPAYPTGADLSRILGQPGSLYRTLAVMMARVYGPAALKRAAADPSPSVSRAAQRVLAGQTQ